MDTIKAFLQLVGLGLLVYVGIMFYQDYQEGRITINWDTTAVPPVAPITRTDPEPEPFVLPCDGEMINDVCVKVIEPEWVATPTALFTPTQVPTQTPVPPQVLPNTTIQDWNAAQPTLEFSTP